MFPQRLRERAAERGVCVVSMLSRHSLFVDKAIALQSYFARVWPSLGGGEREREREREKERERES